MIVFALAALADILTTHVVGKSGGVEGHPLLRKVPSKLRWVVQVAAYAAIALMIYDMPEWVALLVALLPASTATNNAVRYWRHHVKSVSSRT